MNFQRDSQQPFALVFDFSTLLVDNLNWNSCILYIYWYGFSDAIANSIHGIAMHSQNSGKYGQIFGSRSQCQIRWNLSTFKLAPPHYSISVIAVYRMADSKRRVFFAHKEPRELAANESMISKCSTILCLYHAPTVKYLML
jgi:hypothetical protein